MSQLHVAYVGLGRSSRLDMRLQGGTDQMGVITNNQMIPLTIHPTETFSWHHLEIKALIAVFSVHHVRKFYSIELHNPI